ncbi:MAG TPA: hemerythrin domain-containing protein [Actinomycetota bacterium]
MADEWASFREEHSHLRAGIESLRTVGDDVGRLDVAVLRYEVEDVYRFLSHRLLAHIAVEEEVLYPAIARLNGYGAAAGIMRRDHAEVSDAVRELYALRQELERGTFGETEAAALRRVLYGLYQLLKVHMANEEEICLPALDQALSEGQVRELAEEIELYDAAAQAAE